MNGGVTLGLQKQSVTDVVTRGGRFFPAWGGRMGSKGCVRGFLSREVGIQGRPTIILFPSSFRAPQLAPLTASQTWSEGTCVLSSFLLISLTPLQASTRRL